MTDLLLDELLTDCLNITTGNFGSTFPEPQSDGNTRPLFSSLNISLLSLMVSSSFSKVRSQARTRSSLAVFDLYEPPFLEGIDEDSYTLSGGF